MRQKATVIELKGEDGELARVRVLRSAMCEGCENRSDGKACACSVMLGTAREMIVDAQNPLSATVGDDVEIETETDAVLTYAALVFLLPIAGALLFYLITSRLFSSDGAAWIAALIGFALSFLPAFFIDRAKRKKLPDIRIVSVVRHEHEETE